jgi:hypothetical protein
MSLSIESDCLAKQRDLRFPPETTFSTPLDRTRSSDVASSWSCPWPGPLDRGSARSSCSSSPLRLHVTPALGALDPPATPSLAPPSDSVVAPSGAAEVVPPQTWSVRVGGQPSAPIVRGRVAFVSSTGGLTAVHLRDGTIAWTANLPPSSCERPAAVRRVVVVSCGEWSSPSTP